MPLSIWASPLSSFTFQDIAEFVDGRFPEDEQLEYKAAKHNEQSNKLEYTADLLETIVAFANTGGGVILLGVSDDTHGRPESILGIDRGGKRNSDPEGSIRNACAAGIEPHVAIDTRLVEDDSGGNELPRRVLIIRVRAGRLPPYSQRGRGIMIRHGDHDRVATVREIEALFSRRQDAENVPAPPWRRIQGQVFTTGSFAVEAYQTPHLMAGLTPSFPIEAVPIDERTDEAFTEICRAWFRNAQCLVRLPDGMTYDPALLKTYNPDLVVRTNYGAAFSDGTIGVRMKLTDAEALGDPTSRPLHLNALGIADLLFRTLRDAREWPSRVCRYDGVLYCRLSLTNLTEAHFGNEPAIPSPQALWNYEAEWARSEDLEALIHGGMASLARQLQMPSYSTIRNSIQVTLNGLKETRSFTVPS